MIRHATAGLALQVYVEPNIETIYNDPSWVVRVQGIVSKFLIQTPNLKASKT
jgi:hypothetical protein